MEETKDKEITIKIFYGSEVSKFNKITSFASLIDSAVERYSLKQGEFQISYFTNFENDCEVNDDESFKKAIQYFEGKTPKFVIITEELVAANQAQSESENKEDGASPNELQRISEGSSNDDPHFKISLTDSVEERTEHNEGSQKGSLDLVVKSEANKKLTGLIEELKDQRSATQVDNDKDKKSDLELKPTIYRGADIANNNIEVNQSTLDKLTQCITEAAKKELKEFIPQVIKEYDERLHEQELRRDISLYRGVEHSGVACSNCGNSPIMGIRYKCAICEKFDICSKCEALLNHKHALLKFKTPKDFRQFVKQVSKY